MSERISNYDRMREDAERRFLSYDQQHMIEKFRLKHDERYLYLRFVERDYRIDRRTGRLEWSEDAFAHTDFAGFGETLVILDLLCDSKEGCQLAGRFARINQVRGVCHAVSPGAGDDFYREYAEYFDRHREELEQALRSLGGTPERPGDVAYRIAVFEFLPLILQFWGSDEEFPCTLKFMWDENTLEFIRFETAFYCMNHVLERIKERMENGKPGAL